MKSLYVGHSISVFASLPSWERGLKYSSLPAFGSLRSVAPLVGARIEIATIDTESAFTKVAPLVGARIEISEDSPLGNTAACRSPRGSED